MAWDDTHSKGDDLTSTEWNNHVQDQKSRLPLSGGTMTGPIDMNANPIQDSGTNAITFDGSQNVGIPNGDLTMGPNKISFDPNNGRVLEVSTADAEYNRVQFPTTDTTDSVSWGRHTNIAGGNVALFVQNGTAGNHLLRVRDGGNVEIPNGNLTVSGHLDASFTQITDTASIFEIISGNTSDRLKYIEKSGHFEINYNDASAGTQFPIIEYYDNGNVEVPNGDLLMGQNQINNVDFIDLITGGSGSETFRLNVNSSGEFDLYDLPNNQVSLRAYQGGNVEIPNGFLNVSSGRVQANNTDGFQMPNRGGSSDVQRTQINTTLTSGITEIQATDGAGNTTTLT